MFHSSNTTNQSNVALAMNAGNLSETTTIRVIKGIAYFIVFWWSVVGNSLVVAIVYRKQELRTSINYMIVNMAVSDLLFTLVTIAVDFARIISGDPFFWALKGDFGTFCCKVNNFILDVTVAVSVMTMLVIASERFRATVFPMKLALIQKERCAVAIAIIWIISGLLNSPDLYRYKVIPITENKGMCELYWDPPIDGREANRIIWFINVGYIALSFALMAVLYLKIFLTVRKRESSMKRLGSTTSRLREQTTRRVNAVLLAVVLVFVLTWSPTLVYFSLTEYKIVRFSLNVGTWIFFLTRTYQAINPCIYFVFNKAYRQGLLEILRCRNRRSTKQKCNRTSQLLHTRNNSKLAMETNSQEMEMQVFHKEDS